MKFSELLRLKNWANFKTMILFRTCSSSSNRKSEFSYLYPARDNQNKIPSLVKHQPPGEMTREDINRLKTNLRRRGLPDVDLDALARSLSELREIVTKVDEVEKARESNTTITNERLSAGAAKESIEHMFKTGQNLRAQLKELTVIRHQLEDATVPTFLFLPNELHPVTPVDSPRISLVHLAPPHLEFTCLGHVTIGRLTGTLEIVDDITGAYYLHGRAALLELAVQDMLAERMSEAGFVPTFCPDFCKPVVSEGCGLDAGDPADTLWLAPEGDTEMVEYHLTGSASLPAFCAYHAKQMVDGDRLPLKYFTSGRRYRPPPVSASSFDLFCTSQAVETHFFAAGSRADADRIFEESVVILRDTLLSFGELHFRSVEVDAGQLHRNESRKTEFQLWSPYSGSYRTVSAVALCGDFISRRLWMTCRRPAGNDFLHVVHGTGLSVPVLLACLMENFQTSDGNFNIPDQLKRYMLSFND